MKEPCKTCPFAGKDPVELHPDSLANYTENLIYLQSQHLCHTADNKKICRGGRQLQLRVMFLMKLIPAPTDEALDKEMKRVLGDEYES